MYKQRLLIVFSLAIILFSCSKSDIENPKLRNINAINLIPRDYQYSFRILPFDKTTTDPNFYYFNKKN